ncbi:ATP-binding protein [Actinoplanes sp. NPDC049265]|uniref:ATP-binding protein n=1 Tax=Actinoplanes sp. NPDC049265 TaxID=3363902 RepID=UPI003720A88A
MRSNDYAEANGSEEFNSPDTELVTSPGHGAVGVFQAPQPVRPRANGGPGLDNSLDIDSPFLDLFGGAPASAPPVPPPAEEPHTPPSDDDDFDFGFEFEERTPAGAPAPASDYAAPPELAVLDPGPPPELEVTHPNLQPDLASAPTVEQPAARDVPEQPSYADQPAYPEQPAYPDQPSYSEQAHFGEARADGGESASGSQSDLDRRGAAPAGPPIQPPPVPAAPPVAETADYDEDFGAGLEDWPDEVRGGAGTPVSPAAPPRRSVSGSPLNRPLDAPPLNRPLDASPSDRRVDAPPSNQPFDPPPADQPFDPPPAHRPLDAPPDRSLGRAPRDDRAPRDRAPGRGQQERTRGRADESRGQAADGTPPGRPVSAPPVSTAPLWQTVATPDRRHANGQHPGVTPVPRAPERELEPLRTGRALAEPETRDLPATMPEKAPARKRKRTQPDNLPAVRRKEVKPAPLKPNKIKFSDRDPAIELAISEIAGHLTFTQSTVTAWYWLPEVRWAFRPDAEREALLSAISEQYAGLAGFRLHLRRTTRPFPADEWARTVDSLTAKPLADVAGATSWSDHLVAAQRHLLSVNHAEGQTYLGVTFARRSLGDTFSERVLRVFGKGTSDGERRKLGRTVEQFDEVLNAFGMRGRRVSPQELEWLLFRSVALCMAPPGPLSPVTSGQWDSGDLLALTEQVERYRTPYGSTVKLVNRMTGEERHVAVLSVGRMEPLEIPEKHEPWLHFHERLPWPMELSSRIDILGSGSSFKNLEHRLRMIRSQQLDYAEHGIDAPPELERLAKRALVIGDEMTTGLPVESARAHGWHRIAVGGRTREECLERARRLIQLYSRELRISLQHPKNQDQLAREFIPGEPIANTGYVRRMPVKLLAAALPQAASTVGDRRGDLIGRTAGTCRRPVFLDLHFPMEVRERSGLGVFVAEPGGGKSTLMGALGYLNARRGVQVTLLDPSGPLARLCQMPELRPYSRVLNLTGSEQGTLAPYALIPTPVRSEFPAGPGGDREYEIGVSNARAERRMLVQDICSMLVPPQVAKEASTATLLRHAVRQVPAEETSTLDDVVRTLQGLDDDGKELANLLLDTAEMPLALLFFGSPPRHLLGADATLTVITMAGLRLPDLKIEREYWSAEESLALPMLHTAHRLAVRRSYGGSMSARKMVGLDEAHFMEGWRSGRSFLVRLARDSRKWNLAALVASQNPRDILGLDVQNLVSTVFVGRIAEDQEIASEALRLLRVPVHDGYEATLASLSQVDTSSATRLGFREFVMRDVDGRVQKVRVDVSYVDGLLDHLDTTPAAQAPPVTTIPSMSDLEG